MDAKTDVSLDLPAVCQQCKKYNSHLHYSPWHEMCAMIGVPLVLVAVGIAFISGVVKGSTQLYFDSSTIQTYRFVYQKLNDLLSPYQFLVYLSGAWELGYVITGIALLATLNSSRGRLHLTAAILTPLFVFLDMVTSYYYTVVSHEAVAKLSAIVSSDMLSIAAQADMKFEAAYGFWGTQSVVFRSVLYVLGLIVLLVAAASSRVTYSFNPSKTEQKVEVSVPPQTFQTTPPTSQKSERADYKFCRYCGAKIVRTSNYCEECGTKLA